MTTCPHCQQPDIRRVATGAVFDDWLCLNPQCGAPFERVSPAIKRMALIAGVTLLTGGLDLGLLGSAMAAGIGGGDA